MGSGQEFVIARCGCRSFALMCSCWPRSPFACSLRVAEFGGVDGWVDAVFSYLRWRQTDKQHKWEKKQARKKEK
jgi:hypothetical protein